MGTAVVIAIGAVGCIWAGAVSDRLQLAADSARIAQRARVTVIAMAVSAACCLAAALLFHSAVLLLLIALVWGISVIADSAQFSAIISEVAQKSYMGTALTLQTSLGFLLTAFVIRLMAGIASKFSWQIAVASMALGPVLGIWAMSGLMNPNLLKRSAPTAGAPR